MNINFKLALAKVNKLFAASVLSLGVALLPMLAPIQAYAATTNITPAAKVSFTFDDGYTSALTQAATTLAKYGYSGTDYVITNCVGMVTAPNTCRSDNDATYMSWAQIQQLRTTYGWEIGSHTVTHPYLATKDATDGQPQVLTAAQVTNELVNSKSALAAQGIAATDFAAPYGDYNPTVLAQIAKYYASMRGFADTGYNTWPNSDWLVRTQQVQAGVSVATVKGYVDAAIRNNQWLVLTFHDIKTNASTDPADYQYRTADLDAIAAYIKSKNVPVVNVNAGLVTSDTNLLANGSFNSGISGGWTTDVPASITADSANNGSYPDPTNSVKFVAGVRSAHLFSPKAAVDSNTNYMFKSFLNVQKITSGEAFYFVDEYDAFGNWISGQYKKAERTAFVESMNFSYKPSSAGVKQASLQIGISANSGITAFLDNVQMFALQTTAAPVPPVTQTNLLPNGTFDNGIADGWTTNSATTITKDTLSNGSPANVVNSIKAVASSTNKHLFSPQVVVDSTKNYSLSSYVNIKTLTSGEVGFYIDEYDVNGNWISGQYKTGARAVGAGDIAFNYTPSGVNVKKASLQVIIVANSGLTAYIDDAKWFAL